MAVRYPLLVIKRCFAAAPTKTIIDVQKALERHVSMLSKNVNKSNYCIQCNNLNLLHDKDTILLQPHKLYHYSPLLEKFSRAEVAKYRTMNDSKDQVVIPLSSVGRNEFFYKKYISWSDNVRFGILLEDLDTFAVWLAYRHNHGNIFSLSTKIHEPMTFVTACVDHIKLDDRHKIGLDEDIYMQGFVSWVGRSSLEVSMQLVQNSNSVPNKFLQSKFVMVARDLEGKRSLTNVPLVTTNSKEESIFNEGKEAHILRKLKEEKSLLKTPPNEEETTWLHDMFKKTIQFGGYKVQGRILPPNHVWIHDACLSNSIICFPVKRNIYGKIFGGFLMRKALELAWSNACLFSGNRCNICGVDDIIFRKSVDVGAILLLSSQVKTNRFLNCHC
ncbi:unnamed protein product [Thelazia callipaeda]|uniref:Acyl-coenzyme A thioesterase 9, mitochondrial n=1 Tax=Thelazia callipaeda TaxID=103827 RepID=A0A0N5D1N0_THECL|nr:unnamed protein product [Thelazia callipaeda]